MSKLIECKFLMDEKMFGELVSLLAWTKECMSLSPLGKALKSSQFPKFNAEGGAFNGDLCWTITERKEEGEG